MGHVESSHATDATPVMGHTPSHLRPTHSVGYHTPTPPTTPATNDMCLVVSLWETPLEHAQRLVAPTTNDTCLVVSMCETPVEHAQHLVTTLNQRREENPQGAYIIVGDTVAEVRTLLLIEEPTPTKKSSEEEEAEIEARQDAEDSIILEACEEAYEARQAAEDAAGAERTCVLVRTTEALTGATA